MSERRFDVEEMIKRFDEIAAAFGDFHFSGPQLEIKCRHGWKNKDARFYASFTHVEIGDGGILIGASGNGSTPEEAMADYLYQIYGKKLVYKAMFEKERKEIVVL
jgi:hypothetical protein